MKWECEVSYYILFDPSDAELYRVDWHHIWFISFNISVLGYVYTYVPDLYEVSLL